MTTTKKVGQILNLEAPDLCDAFTEVELTEEEINSALLKAKQAKYASNKLEEYKKKLIGEHEFKFVGPSELYTKLRDSGFILDDTNKQIIWNLCRYFCGDPRGPYDLRKGIMLYGPVGCYKTSLMNFFRYNQSNSYCIFHVNDISSQFSKEGHDAIQRYKDVIKITDTFPTFGQKEIGICFDDFGVEVDKKHYGNESNVLAEIILCRHINHQKLFSKTHFTTNLSTDAIEERYGLRVRSRLREMVNLVAFPDDSPDRRK